MKILFLVYHGFSEVSGISKKIHYQVKGLRENGYGVHLCYYDFDANGHRCRYVDDKVIKDYGTGALAGLRQRIDFDCIYDYCKENGIQFVYARCFQNASPFLIRFFKKLKKSGIKAVTEIPTYPYDQEFETFSRQERLGLKIDQMFRNRLYRQQSAVVTFSDAETIFGQRTIRISNGVDFDSIPLHHFQPVDDALHFIGVAEVHLWHGYDRLIAGLGEYYKKVENPRNIIFHIVGDIDPFDLYGQGDYPGIQTLIDQYGIQKHVVFHGQLFGEELNKVFNQSCFAIGSLARHRSGITYIKTLKNREYATRGIPFIYSEIDSDFENKSYIVKAKPDESPIDVQQIVDFIESRHFDPAEIRKTVENLTWKIQMKRVVDEA
ncbi:MAG: glycosyltransferase family 1 protein [Prevotella sp.]|nr:glycosyltransferase family 1 protein [Prevotella sp.]